MTFLGFVGPDSHEECANKARAAGWLRYYALQWGKQCFGSNGISEYTTPGVCDSACRDKPSQQWCVPDWVGEAAPHAMASACCFLYVRITP